MIRALGRSIRHYRKISGLLTALILMTSGSLWYYRKAHSNQADVGEKTFQNDSDDIVIATGVTKNGIDAVTFAIDFLEGTSLYVEDVYLSDGDIVTAGEAYVKFTDDSIEKARAKLEKAVQSAELDYRSKVVANGEDKIQAKYTYDTAVLEAGFAPQVYQDTLAELDMQLVKAEKAFEAAQEEYNEYYNSVVNNTFYEDYQIEKLKKSYEDAYDLFARRRAYWGVTQEEFDTLSDKDDAQKELSDRQWIIRTVALLKEEMTDAQEEYEQARQAYEREIEGAERKLQMLLNQLERAQQGLIDAQLAHQKGSLHAKTLYELAVAKGQTAKSDYNACLMRLEDELERQKDAWDKAVENKAFFEELVGDGYLYTERAGTVFMAYAEKGQALAGGSLILAYENPEKIYVSAMMPERSTAKLSAGEKASVTVADGGSFDGIVEAVQPITTSGSKTSGYNMVMVSLNGDVGMIQPDLTASVALGENVQDDVVQCSTDGTGTQERKTASAMYDFDFDINEPDILAEASYDQTNCLKIKEMYVEEGQHVNEGDPVCQLTQDSMESVQKALVRKQYDAGIALARAQTSYHIGVLEAGLFHNEAMLDKTLAQTVYDNTIAKLNSNMVAKILETEQLLADIYQMQTDLTDENLQKKRAEITSAYDRAKKQVEKARECYVTNQVEAAQNFQEAKEAYETFFSQLKASNQQIADKVAKVYALQEEILQSQQLMEKELLTADQTRISAQTEGEIADAKYAGILKEYENALNKAQAEFDQAARRLDELNQFAKEGMIYAAGSGLVTAVGYSKGDWLVDSRKLVSFVADADTKGLIEEGEIENTQ